MTEVLLAVIEHEATAGAVLAAAARLGRLVGGATIEALAVRTPPEATIVPGEEILTERHAAWIRSREAARTAGLRAAYEAWHRANESPSEWHEVETSPEAALGSWGSRADTIVIARTLPDDAQPDRALLRAALFLSDRPVLLVPPGDPAPFGRHVAIAWHDDRPSIKAVLAALRWLDRAERIEVLIGGADAALPPILAEHGIAATCHALVHDRAPLGAALLDRAHALGADMLIAGAYAHSPLRELVLGGVTRHLLGHADLPVLTRH
jgi:nucleotide-binding universal stress UspA family protein